MLLRHPIPKDAKAARPRIFARMRTPAAAETVAGALPGRDLDATVESGPLAGIAKLPAADVILLDIDFGDPAELAAAERLIADHHAASAMMVTSANPGVDGMRRLLRLGITDLLPQPLRPAELVEAILRAVRPRRGGGGGDAGQILSLLKCGGGAGATSLAVQGACAMGARGGERSHVCVLDLDIQFGAVGLHLELDAKASILDLVETAERLDATMMRALMTHHRSGIDVLPAPRHVHPLESLSADRLLPVLDLARREYKTVLLDLPQPWTAWTREVLAASDRVALVLQLTVPSIRLAQRQLETIADEGLTEVPLALVANRVPKGLFAEQAVGIKEAEAALERRIDHTVHADAAAMFTAANLGVPLVEVKGGEKLARRMAEVIAAILAPQDTRR